MKRLLLGIFLLFPSLCLAGGMALSPRYERVVASGSISAGNLLADLTSTNAFVAPVGVNLSSFQDGRHIFRAQNTATGAVAFGFIMSTPPSGPTLDSSIVVNGTDWTGATGPTRPTSWDQTDAAKQFTITGGGVVGNCLLIANTGAGEGPGGIQQPLSVTDKALYYFSGYIKNVDDPSWGRIRLLIGATSVVNTSSVLTDWVLCSGYGTIKGSVTYYLDIRGLGGVGTGALFDSLAAQQVTDPASTGARIVSTKGGATRSWVYRHASFNPNAACTYQILFVGD